MTSWRLMKIIPAVGLVVLLGASPLWAAVGIRPAYVEVKLDKGRPAGRFMISNLGETEERFRVKAIHFTYSTEGGLTQAKTGKNSLAQWIYFNPKELTIAPKTQRAVRFAIVPRGVLKKGEYWAAMELESLRTREVVKKDPSGKSVRLRLVATIMVPIFGTVGDIRYEGTVKEVKLVSQKSETFLQALVTNEGTGRLGAKGTYEIANASGKVIEKGKVGSAYILRGAQRRFTKKIEVPLPQGRYTLRVRYTAVHLKKPLEREVQVVWTPPPKSESAPSPLPKSESAPSPTGGSTSPTQPPSPAKTQPAERSIKQESVENNTP